MRKQTSFDPYHKWLGIPPKDQPPNHYRLIGIDLFETDADVIDTAANKQMTYLHGCSTGEHSDLAEKLLNEIAAVRLCLLDPKRKAEYDEKLKPPLRQISPAVEAFNFSPKSSSVIQSSRLRKKSHTPLVISGAVASLAVVVGWLVLAGLGHQDQPGTNSIGMKLKLLPSGTFTMGEGGEAHKVTLTKPFELGVHEVTQEQYQKVVGTNPSKFKGPQNPVEQVSWNDAVAFCRRLSELPAEKSGGYVYRLPTEAEWEYACRAGTTTKYSFGDSESELGAYAWYDKNSGGTPHPVGGKKPNGWGLYDMHGNVWEWCQDWYGDYPSGSTTDPTGAASGSLRVLRGGSWILNSGGYRSADRGRRTPDYRFNNLGFRVLRSSIK